MNYSYVSFMFGPTMTLLSLLVLVGLIVELSNANINENPHKQAVVKAKKLDVNNDGFISLDELTRRPKQRFKKQGRKEGSPIDEADFNARLLAMFNRMDSNSDGMLDDIEISKPQHHHDGRDHNRRRMHEKWLQGSRQGGKQNESGLPAPAFLSRHYLPIRLQQNLVIPN